jgi:hypothetical protein
MRALAVSLSALVLATVAASTARANGDPASDVLIGTDVFLSLKAPVSSSSGRELRTLTSAAKKSGRPIKVAVIAQITDLGLVGSLWREPQSYAEFLGRELKFGYHGTLVVTMPNGFGVFGPDKTPAALRVLKGMRPPQPATLEQLGDATATAIRRIAAVNGHPISTPHKSNTTTYVVIAAVLAGALLGAAILWALIRRWLGGEALPER